LNSWGNWQKCEIFTGNLTGKRLTLSYVLSGLFLILGSRNLSKKGEALLIFTDFLICGAGNPYNSQKEKEFGSEVRQQKSEPCRCVNRLYHVYCLRS
jgi:hypothetical protein